MVNIPAQIKRILYIILISAFATVLSALEENEKNLDYLSVAAVLISDGNYARARESLNQVDIEDEDLDKIRYYTLLGLVQLRNSEYADAVKSFQNALHEGQDDPVIYAYIAQGYFAQGLYPETIETIDKLPNINIFPDLYGIKSQAYWQLDDIANAFGVLESGIDRFPKKEEFQQQKIVYLLELELNQEAASVSRSLLDIVGRSDPERYIAVGQAFARSGEKSQAVHVLEMAKLLFPDNQRIRLALAQVYVKMEMYTPAAKIVEEAAAYDHSLYVEAAELYRSARQYRRAMYLNSLVADHKDKVQQRFSLLIDLDDYESAYALESRMLRLGILNDEGYMYAMAYVLFNLQKCKRANEYLNRITGNSLFREATLLRQSIEIMKKNPLQLF